MRPIIGFIGYARSGKDTAAEALTARGYKRVAFADALKADCEKIIGQPFTAMTPEQKEFWRPLLVEYGRLRRAQHPDFWVWQVESALKMVEPSTPVCITDVRYSNECRWILEQGGILVMVTRPKCDAANAEEARSIMEILEDTDLFAKVWMLPNTSDVTTLKRRAVDIAHAKVGIP
jgi:hypothetical protein